MHTRSSEQMEGDGGACPVDASKETKAMDLDHQDDSEADSADANAVATSPDIAVQGDEKEHEGGEGSNGSKMDEDPVYAETHPSDTESVATSPVIAVQGDGKEHEGDEGADGSKMDEDQMVADATQPEESAANVKTLSQVNGNGIIEGPVAKPMVVTESHEQGLVNAPTLAHEGDEGSNGSKMDGDPVGAETHSADTNAVATSPVIAVQGNGKEQDGDEGSNGNKMDEDQMVADATQPEESAANVNTLSQVNDNEVTLSATQDIEGQGGTPKDVHTPAKGRDSNKSPRNKRGKKASCKYWNHITPIVISFFSS